MGSKLVKKIRYALRFLPDELYLQLNYFPRFKRFANLREPKTYNEKLNWLKLHDRNPLYTRLVDKYEVKAYVDELLGGGYTIPTLGLWENVDDIDFSSLPERFVLKCTHDSGSFVICKNKAALDEDAVKTALRSSLRQNFYYIGREWPYKDVPPRVIAEAYLEDTKDGELRDYKFFCFDGQPKILLVVSGRNSDHATSDFFDMEFVHLDIQRKYPNAKIPLRKPECFAEMIQLSRKLSAGFPHVRVDFYEIDGRPYFGELTFYTSSGFVPFRPDKWDRIMGDWINLPE